MSFDRLKRDIEEENLAVVYLLYGEDRYSLLQSVQGMKKLFLREDPSGSNIEIMQGKEIPVDQIIETLNSSALFSRKLVIVDNAPYFDQAKRKQFGG